MPATTAYQAGIESTQTLMSYGIESVWGTAPGTALTDLRITSETLSGAKKRDRPGEINQSRQVSQNVTTQETAAGAINFGLSYGTFDDLMSSCLGADWGTSVAIVGVAGDIAISAPASGVVTLTSTTAGKFTGVVVGQWIRTSGFTNAVNNTFLRVTSVTGTVLQCVTNTTTVAETPAGTAARITGSMIRNGTIFKSLFMQQRLSSSLFLQYPGALISDFSIDNTAGGFVTGSASVIAQAEINAVTDVSVGAHIAAPSGVVHDTVSNFRGIYVDGLPLAAVANKVGIKMTNTGAAAQFGLGSSAAQGMTQGEIEVTGNLEIYFRDFTIYQRFKSETLGPITFVTRQSAGGPGYAVTILNAEVMNPKVDAGGPSQPVMATFDLAGNPDPTTGLTVQIDRMA